MRQKTPLQHLLFSCMLLIICAAQAQSQDAVALNISTKAKVMEVAGDDAPDAAAKGAPAATLHSIFPEVTNDTWYSDKKGFTNVHFETPGKVNRVVFDKKGKIIYSISYYHKEMLPVWILQKMNDKYAGKSIFGVTETTDNNGTSYVLVLEDKSCWIDVTISGNEIQEEQVWNKSTL